MDVSENRVFSPQIIHFNRIFHYFHYPLWGTPIFGNTYILEIKKKTALLEFKTVFKSCNSVTLRLSSKTKGRTSDKNHSKKDTVLLRIRVSKPQILFFTALNISVLDKHAGCNA